MVILRWLGYYYFAKNIKSLQREDFGNILKVNMVLKVRVFLAGNFTETEVKKLFKDNLSQMGKNNYQDKLKVVEKRVTSFKNQVKRLIRWQCL